ncbi:MAG: alpha/beta fold hydrolase [Bacillota bacterium]
MAVIEHEATLERGGAPDIFYRVWQPGAPKGIVVIVHGSGEHSGRYQPTASFLAENGYFVYALDLRGQGRSQGLPGHVDRFDHYLDDIGAVLELARQRSTAPLFLLGHSVGGLLALTFGLRYPSGLAGVIASGPCLALSLAVPPLKAAAGRLLSRLWPTLRLPSGIRSRDLASDPEVGRRYSADPLVVRVVSARYYTELEQAMAFVRGQATTFARPLLILQGADDRLVSSPAVREFFQAAGSTDKTLEWYDGAHHELLNDYSGDRVRATILDWLDRRVVL